MGMAEKEDECRTKAVTMRSLRNMCGVRVQTDRIRNIPNVVSNKRAPWKGMLKWFWTREADE